MVMSEAKIVSYSVLSDICKDKIGVSLMESLCSVQNKPAAKLAATSKPIQAEPTAESIAEIK